jgi:hypothetical protein
MFDEDQVAVELVSGYLTVTHPHEVAMYGRTFADLAALAVHGAAARTLITEAVTALSKHG